MSLPAFIYIIGSVFAIIIAIRMTLREVKGDLTIMDLSLLLLISCASGLLSWFLVVAVFLNKYKDKVIIKQRRTNYDRKRRINIIALHIRV